MKIGLGLLGWLKENEKIITYKQTVLINKDEDSEVLKEEY